MKLTNHWGELGGGKQSFRGPTSSPAETAVFVTLGMTGFVAVAIAVVSGSKPARLEEATLADLKAMAVAWHAPSGQFVADMRAVVATAQDLSGTERRRLTNLIESASTQKNLAMPTNTPSG